MRSREIVNITNKKKIIVIVIIYNIGKNHIDTS